MSTTIDNKVVEMRFDNKQFESNVATTMSSLDKLKQSLNLEGAAKGFDGINAAAKKIDMSGLGNAVETVRMRFSALEVMAVTALANITNSVINTGKQMIKSLTVDPIKDGFNEYELKMGSIQTIMASTGESLETVNGYLNELNTYSDKTIYSFADMTNNIGKFTNAGVKLDDAVKAIQGISNEAAVSGANANEASRAMYNFAQALSAGYVKLIDWKSIENANMATVEFKDQLIQTALSIGTVTKAGDGMYKTLDGNVFNATRNFNEVLQDQWMTSEVLIETLKKYADETTEIGKKAFASAQDVKTFTQLMDTLKEAVGSGWATTWEILFGNFEEAKSLWTDVSKVVGEFIDKQADARNELLQGWKDLGGRKELIDAFKNIFHGVVEVIKPVKEAFTEIFPATTAEQLYKITKSFKEFTSKLKLSKETSDNLKDTFKGLFAVLDIVKQAFSSIFKAISPLTGGFSSLGGGILSITGSIGRWLVKLDESIKKSDIFNKAMQGIVGFVEKAAAAIKKFIGVIKDKFGAPGLEIFHSLLERVKERLSQVSDASSSMKDAVVGAVKAIGESLENSDFLMMLQALWNGVKRIGEGLVKALSSLVTGLGNAMSGAGFNGFLDAVNSIIAGGIGVAIYKFVKGLKGSLEDLGSIKDSVIGILDSVKGCFEAYQSSLKADVLLKIAGAIAILTASIIVLSLIDSDKLAASLGAITGLFAELMGAMAIFTKISGDAKGLVKSSTAMIGMAMSILILAGALKKVGELDFGQIASGLFGIAGLATIMIASAKILGNGGKTVIKGALQMVIFAAAIKVLASACTDLSNLKWDELARGLTGVGVLMAEIAIFLKTAKFSGKSITTATGIVILAAAMKILASAVGDFGTMDWSQIGKGLTSIGVLLAEISAFTRITGNAKHVISTGVALIAIGAAMKIFASSIKDMSTMNWEELAKGLTGMAGSLLAVTVAVKLMPKNMVGIGVGLIAVSAALVILSNVLLNLGGMKWEEIAKGLVALGGAMAIMAIGLNAMNGTLSGSAALIVAAGALLILTPALIGLGSMSWESIAKGLIAIAGAFTILGVAGLLLQPLVPTILGLAGAFALIGAGVLGIGVGLLAAGAGLSALAVGFTALSVALSAGATSIVAALTVIIVGVADLIPLIIQKIGEGIIALCVVIAEGAPAICEAVRAIIISLVDVLVECVPAIAKGALELVVGVLDALVEYTPRIVDAIFQFLIGLLEGVARNLPALIQATVDVFMAYFSGIVEALKSIDTETLVKGIIAVGLISALMVALAAIALLTPGAMLGVIGMGAVISELAIVLAAIGALAQIPGLSWLINEGGKLLQDIGTAIGSFIGGIVGGFMGGVSSQFPQIANDLSAFMTNIQPFINGARSIDPSVMDGVTALAGAILALTAANVIDGLTSWFTGGSSLADFGEELATFGPSFNSFYQSIKGIDGEVVSASANAALALGEMASKLPNSGGVAGWFMGENSLAAFADELVKFGPSLKKYADSVTGLDPNVVTNSANAASAISEMASNLPNSGGVVGWFMGENSLAAFGEELSKFGPYLKKYADSVSGLDSNVVLNSANAAMALSELAENLPNAGGVVSWFTGDNSLGAFGESLVKFGQKFASYCNSVSGIDISHLSGVIVETRKLVSMAKSMVGIDTSGMSSFGDALTKLGTSGVDGFIKAFTNGSSKATKAVTDMLSSVINAVNSKKSSLTITFTNLIQDALNSINAKKKDFKTAGTELMTNFVSGIKSVDTKVSSLFTKMAENIMNIIGDRSKWSEAGANITEGILTGVVNNASSLYREIENVMATALSKAKNVLGINSPSKEFSKLGMYSDLGFAYGLDKFSSRVSDSSENLAKTSIKSFGNSISKLRSLVESGADTEPTIRPVLDLSNVEYGARKLNALFSRDQAMSISAKMSRSTNEEIQNGEKTPSTGSTITFTQNNYSPKALSRLDIYRQTKNQLSAMKGLV